MTEIVHGAAPVREREPVLTRWLRTVDLVTLGLAIALFLAGLMLSAAATPPLAERTGQNAFYYVGRQGLFGAVALALMLVTSMLNPTLLRRLAVRAFALVLLSLVLLPFFGVDLDKGSTRWFSTPFGTLQPSEFAKPLFVVFAAWLIAWAHEVDGPPGRSLSFVGLLVLVGLFLAQPDVGQTVLISTIWFVIWLVGGARWIFVFIAAVIFSGIGILSFNHLPHVSDRLLPYLSGEVEPYSQMDWALTAIRDGGFFGSANGALKWRLPDGHTDFIIAVAAEEYGLMAVLAILTGYIAIFLRSYARLMLERDMFYRLAGVGLVTLFTTQAFVNLGVAAQLLPATGMTLPFISYGGSSLLASGLTIGMLLVFTSSRPQPRVGEFLRGRGA